MSAHHGEEGVFEKIGGGLQKKVFGFNPFDLSSFVDWAGSWGVSRALTLSILYIGLLGILALEIPNLPLFALEWIIGTAPITLPVGLAFGSMHGWIEYVQMRFLLGRKPVLLEMKIPRDIYKSPRAMEIALTNFWISSGEVSFINRAWKGQVRPFWALEIASFGGDIHFYIWCWSDMKSVVEQAIYGQYPEVELFEAEDYASLFHYDPKKHWCFASDWRKEPADTFGTYGHDDFDRVDAYPIKTYVDFELDKDPKEEFKIDPLSSILEFMGSIQPNEQVWASLVIRQAGKYHIFNPQNRNKEWRDVVTTEVDKIRARAAIISKKSHDEVYEELGEDAEKPERQVQGRPSWRQNRVMESMERNLGKLPFEFIGHGLYITEGKPRGPLYTGMRWLWRPLGNAAYMAQIAPSRWHNPFDYPWQDFRAIRWNIMLKRFLDVYRRRGGFHHPLILPSNILTVEELATMWHPPSRTTATPGLERMPATKAAPPSNLPT